jgi:hypothetical protein
MTYDVEGWVVLKYTVTSAKVYYRIFASWRGGNLNGESWRLSSGSEALPHLSDCGKYWLWPQLSGSLYKLPINEEDGYTFYTGQVLSSIIERSGEEGTFIERITLASLQNIPLSID